MTQAWEEPWQIMSGEENACSWWVSSLEEGAALPLPWEDVRVQVGDGDPFEARLHQQQSFLALG